MRSRIERVALKTLGGARYFGESAALRRPEVVDAARVGASALRAHAGRPRWESAEQRVLFFSPRYWSIHQAWEGTIAHALEQRGAATRFVSCGGAMPLCDAHLLERMGKTDMTCVDCVGRQPLYLGALGHRTEPLTSFLSGDAIPNDAIDAIDRSEALAAFTFAGHPVGKFVEPSVLRFFRAGALEGNADELHVAREFVRGACAVLIGGAAMLDRLAPTTVVLLNGKFYPERAMWALCEARGIDVVTYERGFIVDTLVFSRNASANDYDLSAITDAELAEPTTAAADAELDAYLEERTRGARSIVQYWPEVEDRPDAIRTALGFDPSLPLTVAFPNILWDTAILDKDIHFDSMFHWLTETIDWFAAHPAQQLVIRCHPAEVRLPAQSSRQRVGAFIEQTFPTLPKNVIVVPPSSPISSYVLARAAERVLVYTSTVGLEMTLAGKEVFVSGQTHYANKGFATTPDSVAHYRALLDRRVTPPSDAEVVRARRYASLFFFRFMLPMRVVEEAPERARIALRYRHLSDLAPGRDITLDVICDGILDARPFLLPRGA